MVQALREIIELREFDEASLKEALIYFIREAAARTLCVRAAALFLGGAGRLEEPPRSRSYVLMSLCFACFRQFLQGKTEDLVFKVQHGAGAALHDKAVEFVFEGK